MAITKIEETRIRTLNDLPPRERGEYVLYWMQQSQRAEHNPALEHAVRRANQHGKPLLVGFAALFAGLWLLSHRGSGPATELRGL